MDELDKLVKELEEMPEEEASKIAKYHLRRYRERLARRRAGKRL